MPLSHILACRSSLSLSLNYCLSCDRFLLPPPISLSPPLFLFLSLYLSRTSSLPSSDSLSLSFQLLHPLLSSLYLTSYSCFSIPSLHRQHLCYSFFSPVPVSAFEVCDGLSFLAAEKSKLDCALRDRKRRDADRQVNKLSR